MIALLALLACTAPLSDRDHYLLAASEPGLSEALAHCEHIQDQALRGECASFAASRAASAGQADEALNACIALGLPASQECAFLVADTAELLGDEARRACDAAGELRFECLCHAADRHALGREDLPTEPGQEEALVVAIMASTDDYLTQERPAVVSQVSRGIAARIVGARWQGGRFEPGLCGGADTTLCRRAYRASLQPWLLSHDVGGLCAEGTPSAAEVEAAGMPGWEESGAEIATSVWEKICEE